MSVSTRLSLLLAGAALSAPLAAAQPPASAIQDCSELRSCAAKFCQIQNEIAAAQANGNTHRESGLRRALAEAQKSCTDESLRQERLKAIDEHQEKVREREAELAEARGTGKRDKIDKAQRKLADAQAELREAQDALQR